MPVNQYIYQELQKECPELFIEGLKTKPTSTVYAEFLPNTALSNPNGSPWGEYSARAIPPNAKTVIISYKAINDMPVLEKQQIDKVARFLKRAGFIVLIPIAEDIEPYDMQLFDHQYQFLIGNKTRSELQKLALLKNIPADALFFIDDLKKEVDADFINKFRRRLELIEQSEPKSPADKYCIEEDDVTRIPLNVGRVTITRPLTSQNSSYIAHFLQNLDGATTILQCRDEIPRAPLSPTSSSIPVIHSGLYCLSLKLDRINRDRIKTYLKFLLDHTDVIEELDIYTFNLLGKTVQEAQFPKLKVTEIHYFEGDFELNAPQLTHLILFFSEKGSHIHLEQFSFLNRLELLIAPIEYVGPESKRKYPTITCNQNLNLTELRIIGNQPLLDFIEPVLANAPNLKLIELEEANIPDSTLKELVRRYPNLRIKITSIYKPIDRISPTTILQPNPDGPLYWSLPPELMLDSSLPNSLIDSSYQEATAPYQITRNTSVIDSDAAWHLPPDIQRNLKKNGATIHNPFSTESEEEEDIVYSAVSDNPLTSDFDTRHEHTKFTMSAACKHLSKKEKRFPHTRQAIYTLNEENLLVPLKANLRINYPVPPAQPVVTSDNAHDFYQFQEKLNLAAGDTFKLQSLSAQDSLWQLTLNGSVLTSADIEIEQDELGFYFLKAKKPLTGNLSYVLDVLENSGGWKDALPSDLQALIIHLRSFPSDEVEELNLPPNATITERLEAMYEQKKGACRHRVALLLYKFNQLKTAEPEVYRSIHVRAATRGGAHVNIELSVDNGATFSVLDLGGYVSQMHYLSDKLPALVFSTKKTKDEPKPDFTEVLTKMERHRGQNTLLCLPQPDDIDLCLAHIRNATSRPVFYVDSKEKLQTSLKRLKLHANRTHCDIVNPPAGLLHDFLMAHQDSDPPPIIVINWDNFSPSDVVQFNSVIDTTNRRVDNTPIPVKATVVGLHSRNEKMLDLLGDSSFVSRHVSGGVHDLTATRLPERPGPFDARESAESSLLIVNLHQSPRWQELLIGRAFIDGNQLNWQDGALNQLLTNHQITKIQLINPPNNDAQFTHFIADLKAGQPLTLLNQTHPLNRALEVQLIKQSTFTTQVPLSITRSEHLSKEAFIINSDTFEQCLHGKKITPEGLLVTQKGLIEGHAGGLLKLCLHDNLSDSQWSLLLDYAKKFNVSLALTLTNNVSIPLGIAYNEEASKADSSAEKPPNQFIVSDDVEYSVAQLKRHLPPEMMVVDLSELSIDDLLCTTDYRITDTGFRFNQKKSTLWSALLKGDTVILKGYCSTEMLHYLASAFAPSPYFYLEGEKQEFKGTLIVVADASLEAPSWLSTERHQVSITQKQEALKIPSDSSCANKPFIQLALEQNKALHSTRIAPVKTSTESSSQDDLSLASCEAFEQARVEAVKEVLSYSPFAVLEGAPGVGKSGFIETLQRDPLVKWYREDKIELWATESVPANVQKILFRDEINLRGIECSQDRDLMNNPPSIFVHGTYYPLSEQCKVMYAQNPQNYGGERHEPQLFKDLPQCKVRFEQMSPAFIVHRILKPIYQSTFDENSSEERAITLISENLSSMRSIRDVQTKAIFECALKDNPIPEPAAGTQQVCLGSNDFVLTASRFEPYKQILTLLQARTFKRNLPAQAADGARFSGVNGLVLQGPPGIGKSEFVESILHNEGYSELTKDTPEAEIEQGRVYYRLRASVSNEEKRNILNKAFQQGALLIIDEIDSCPLLEEYLNAYLVGEDIHGKRADKPGFTILSTANGAALRGRRVLPEPLKSRMLALELKEYSRDELLTILEGACISSIDPHRAIKLEMSAFLVDSFLTEQNTNKETPPTFRELYVMAQKYFEQTMERYCRLGLSKEQQEFMLVYRNHPNLDQLIRRLESKELKASTITLDMLTKELKSVNRQSLFGKTETAHKIGDVNQFNRSLD